MRAIHLNVFISYIITADPRDRVTTRHTASHLIRIYPPVTTSPSSPLYTERVVPASLHSNTPDSLCVSPAKRASRYLIFSSRLSIASPVNVRPRRHALAALPSRDPANPRNRRLPYSGGTGDVGRGAETGASARGLGVADGDRTGIARGGHGIVRRWVTVRGCMLVGWG